MIYLTEEMFSTGKPVAQGEVLIWMKKFAPKLVLEKVAALKNMAEMNLEKGQMILGHSETGHHHVMECIRKNVPISKVAQALIDSTNDTFVELKLYEQCKLVHMRSNDSHGTLVFPAGEYIRGIREEQSPQGWQRVRD